METKSVKPGDVVYWVNRNGGDVTVKFGIVDDVFTDGVWVNFISPKERRMIDGVPLEHFISETRWRKLPKGWTYNTELFKITYRDPIEPIKISDKEGIKAAYQRGDLVLDSTLFWGNVEAVIDRNAGFRVVLKYPMWKTHSSSTSLRYDEVFTEYEDAEKKAEELRVEFRRQCNLTDEEWAIEQITKDVKRWKYFTGASDEDANRILAFFAELDNIVDVETRISGVDLQWKYWKKKKWHDVNPEDLGEGDYKEWVEFMSKSNTDI